MSDVASFLGAAVNVAVNKLARDHPALARRLNWSVEEVKKNTAHALDLARRDLSRQAVVEHITQSLRPRAASPAQKKQPGILERGAAAVRQELAREAWAATHPTEALAKYIHNQRLLPGERHLARANDIVGGSIAGTAAETIDGLGKIADFNHRYLQGGILEDPFVKRGLIPPPVKAADQAARLAAPLWREAELRPPTTLPGQAVAAVPKVASVVLLPGLIGTSLLATQGVGAASHRARQTGAPDNLRTDLGIAATGAINGLAGRLVKTGRVPDPFRFIEQQGAAVRGKLQDLAVQTFAKSAGGAVVSSGQTTLDNAVAKASYDPDRRLDEGLGESAAFGGALGSLGGRRTATRPSAPLTLGDTAPSRSYSAYEILAEMPYSGTSRPWHRTFANRQLHSQINSDEEFGSMMRQTFGDDILTHMNSGAGARLINPPGAIWHHPYDRPGFVQLLRKSEHADPRLQHALHPGPQKGGGYAQHHTAAAAGTDPLQNDRRIRGDQDR